jgi:hypothetical protein
LANDNPASPAEAGHLDSRLDFSSNEETKQIKPAKRCKMTMGTRLLGNEPCFLWLF